MDFIFYIHRWLLSPIYKLIRRCISYREIREESIPISDDFILKTITEYLKESPKYKQYHQSCDMLLIYSLHREYWEVLYVKNDKFIESEKCDITLELDQECIYLINKFDNQVAL